MDKAQPNQTVDQLKTTWLRNPIWNLETTDGFQQNTNELLTYRLDMEQKCKMLPGGMLPYVVQIAAAIISQSGNWQADVVTSQAIAMVESLYAAMGLGEMIGLSNRGTR